MTLTCVAAAGAAKPPVARKLPDSLTLGRLKQLCEQLFKARHFLSRIRVNKTARGGEAKRGRPTPLGDHDLTSPSRDICAFKTPPVQVRASRMALFVRRPDAPLPEPLEGASEELTLGHFGLPPDGAQILVDEPGE